jgi:hypothetical protein
MPTSSNGTREVEVIGLSLSETPTDLDDDSGLSSGEWLS